LNLEQFVGCWKLISHEFKTPEGRVFHPWGDDPVGSVIFDAKGNFSAQIMRRDRKTFASESPTPEEAKAAYVSYMAYYGTFEINAEDGILLNHVEGALNPDWVGGDQIRYFEFSDDKITLRTPPIKRGDIEITGTLAWERVK